VAESPSADRRQIGRQAEQYAAELLRRRGYRILETNVRYRFGELDLIAEDGASLVFVEVRARKPGRYGRAIETLTRAKRRRVYLGVERYLQERRVDPSRPVRIDVVAIDLDGAGRPTRAEVIPDAFGEQ
jgi:putative endonuclease